jgi:hypothetical protein
VDEGELCVIEMVTEEGRETEEGKEELLELNFKLVFGGLCGRVTSDLGLRSGTGWG